MLLQRAYPSYYRMTPLALAYHANRVTVQGRRQCRAGWL
jgi:hypothetical protein